MSLIQACWLIFSIQTLYLFHFTKWSMNGHNGLKFLVCAFVSLMNVVIVYGIGSVYKWLGS